MGLSFPVSKTRPFPLCVSCAALVDVTARDEWRRTPLTLAAQRGALEVTGAGGEEVCGHRYAVVRILYAPNWDYWAHYGPIIKGIIMKGLTIMAHITSADLIGF